MSGDEETGDEEQAEKVSTSSVGRTGLTWKAAQRQDSRCAE